MQAETTKKHYTGGFSLGLPTPVIPDFNPVDLQPTPANLPASITPMISKPLQYEPLAPQKTASTGSQGLSGVNLNNLMSSAGIIPSLSAVSSPGNDQILKQPVSEDVVVLPNDVIKNRVPMFGSYKVVYNNDYVGVSNTLNNQQNNSSSSSTVSNLKARLMSTNLMLCTDFLLSTPTNPLCHKIRNSSRFLWQHNSNHHRRIPLHHRKSPWPYTSISRGLKATWRSDTEAATGFFNQLKRKFTHSCF